MALTTSAVLQIHQIIRVLYLFFDRCFRVPGTDELHCVEFRKTVVTSILATDMSLHSEYVEKINTQGPRIVTRLNLNESEREKDRLLLCSALIKCADISNVVSRTALDQKQCSEMTEAILDAAIFAGSEMGGITGPGICLSR